jgi:poly(hydroxyalkanoate) granule-associated protein
MARSTRTNTGKTSRKTARTASTSAKTRAARPAATGWRAQVEQLVSVGKQAAEFVQTQGSTVVQQAQRRSSALSAQARNAAEARLEAVAEKVVGTWDQVEQVASDRVGRTLNRLGVPSQKDIDKLTRSVAKLSAQIEKLSAAAPRAARSTGRRAATAAAS